MRQSQDPRAVADLAGGWALAAVEVEAGPARLFRALASDEIVRWWVRPGVFDTREWQGDVCPGGRWRASGLGGGASYTLFGQYVHVEPPRRLVHTWRGPGPRDASSTVEYVLEPVEGGTRVTLRHWGLVSRAACANTAAGWETSFAELRDMLAAERRAPAG